MFIFGTVHTDIAGLMVEGNADEMYDKRGNILKAERNTEAHYCNHCSGEKVSTVIPRLTKIIRSGITFVSRNLR